MKRPNRTGSHSSAMTPVFVLSEYICWQQREERAEDERRRRFNCAIIEQGDPEIEAAIAALEEGWLEACQEDLDVGS